jgi:hypothetical protein
VTAGGRNFERAFRRELSSHVDEVAVNRIIVCVENRGGGAASPFSTVTH